MNRKFLTTLVLFLAATATPLFSQSYQFQHSSLPCVNKKFTIVAHIFRDSFTNPGVSEVVINNSVAAINPFFAPIGVSFEVCEFRYHDNYAHDRLDYDAEPDEIKTKYHADFRINMYFLSDFPDACGFADRTGIQEAFKSGIFIKKGNCTNSGTIAHEMGHFFGLLHTFEDSGLENVNGSNCTTVGDLICDTPADPYVDGEPLSQYVDKDCLFISTKTDANGEFYNPDLGNIMSYYECGGCGFTWEQLNKMAQNYLNSGVKFW